MLKGDQAGNTELQLQLATLYVADERPTKAIKVLDAILDADATNWMARGTRADALLSIGKHAEAIEDYDTALKNKPEDEAFRDEVRRFLDDKLTGDLRETGRLMTSVYADYETAMRWQRNTR